MAELDLGLFGEHNNRLKLIISSRHFSKITIGYKALEDLDGVT